MSQQLKKVVLTKRPQGEPVKSDFTLVEAEVPALNDGEVLY